MKRIIPILFVLVCLPALIFIGCDKPISEGLIVDKQHSDAYTYTALQPMMIGKVMSAIPVTRSVPETWEVTISGKGVDGEIETRVIDVSPSEFDSLAIGQYYKIH